jgi:hypothetical protein
LSSGTEEVHQRASELDGRLDAERAKLSLPRPDLVFKQLRLYLEDQAKRLRKPQNIVKLVRFCESHDEFVIELGPSFDKGDSETHFHFPSGARLSFGITLRRQGAGGVLIAYRFCLKLPVSSSVDCFLFNLNPMAHTDPLREPRFHVHPGFLHFRIPLPALSPLDVLDRIFFVIEPAFAT